MSYKKNDAEIFNSAFEPLRGLTPSNNSAIRGKYYVDGVDIVDLYLPVSPNQVGTSNSLIKSADINYKITGTDISNYFAAVGFCPSSNVLFTANTAGDYYFDPRTITSFPIRRMAVLVLGAGGGGGAGAKSVYSSAGGGAGGGGGSGDWKLVLLDTVPQINLVIRVGQGGAGGTITSTHGNQGSNGGYSRIYYNNGSGNINLVYASGGRGGGGGGASFVTYSGTQAIYNAGSGGYSAAAVGAGSAGGAGGTGGYVASVSWQGYQAYPPGTGTAGGVTSNLSPLNLRGGVNLQKYAHTTRSPGAVGGTFRYSGTRLLALGPGGGGGGGGSLIKVAATYAGGLGGHGMNATVNGLSGGGTSTSFGSGGGGGGGGGAGSNGANGGTGAQGLVIIYY